MAAPAPYDWRDEITDEPTPDRMLLILAEKRRVVERNLVRAMREAEQAHADGDTELAQFWLDQFNALDRMLAALVAR